MNGKRGEEIEADLKRAEDSLMAADQLTKDGYFDIAASRAYYAVFYALSALLLNDCLNILARISTGCLNCAVWATMV